MDVGDAITFTARILYGDGASVGDGAIAVHARGSIGAAGLYGDSPRIVNRAGAEDTAAERSAVGNGEVASAINRKCHAAVDCEGRISCAWYQKGLPACNLDVCRHSY